MFVLSNALGERTVLGHSLKGFVVNCHHNVRFVVNILPMNELYTEDSFMSQFSSGNCDMNTIFLTNKYFGYTNYTKSLTEKIRSEI